MIEATRSTSQNRNNKLADRVSRDRTFTKQQIDPATRMMMEQVSRLSDKDYKQMMIVQLFLDCIHRANASSIAFVSFREQPMHFHDNQSLNLRVIDPIADGVWAIIDDGCDSCCHGEVWLHRKATTFNGFGMSTTSGKLKIPMAIQLQESDMVILRCTRNSRQITSLVVVVPCMFSKAGNEETCARRLNHTG